MIVGPFSRRTHGISISISRIMHDSCIDALHHRMAPIALTILKPTAGHDATERVGIPRTVHVRFSYVINAVPYMILRGIRFYID